MGSPTDCKKHINEKFETVSETCYKLKIIVGRKTVPNEKVN